MRYSYEYKIKCIDMYRQGQWPEKPETIKDEEDFHKMIRGWSRIEEKCGVDALKHKSSNKRWTAVERYELVAKVIAGNSIKNTAYEAGINPGMLSRWVQKYKIKGYNGLIEIKKGRPGKVSNMNSKKAVNPESLTESEREELIRLRAENEYIKAEIEVIKKRIALRQEREAAQLKAKKQRLSKNSVNKDTN